MDICLHFDHLKFKTRCELGKGRMAPRDCRGCAAYDPDPGYRSRSTEQGKVRDDAWSAMLFRNERTGV